MELSSTLSAALRSSIAEQMMELEPACEPHIGRWDLHVHTVTSMKEDKVIAFAITSSEGRSKVIVHQLHVSRFHRRCGWGTALLALCEKSAPSRGSRSSPMLEIRVRASNTEAKGFCLHNGFAAMQEQACGDVVVMQRKR